MQHDVERIRHNAVSRWKESVSLANITLYRSALRGFGNTRYGSHQARSWPRRRNP